MDTQIATTDGGQLHAVSMVRSEADAERFQATMERQGYQVDRLSAAEAVVRFARPGKTSPSQTAELRTPAQGIRHSELAGAFSQTPLLSKCLLWSVSALAGLPVTLVESEHVCGGEFDLWPWQWRAQDLALRVNARRSFASAALFGRELNPSAQYWIAKHQEWLKAQAEIKAYAEREAREAEAALIPLLALDDSVQPGLW